MAEDHVKCWTCGGPMPASEALWDWDADPDSDTGETVMVQAASCAACIAKHNDALDAMEV